MSKKTQGMITAFLILFSLSIVFLFSLFVDSWLAKTSFGKWLGISLGRFSFVVSLWIFVILYLIISQFRKNN